MVFRVYICHQLQKVNCLLNGVAKECFIGVSYLDHNKEWNHIPGGHKLALLNQTASTERQFEHNTC